MKKNKLQSITENRKQKTEIEMDEENYRKDVSVETGPYGSVTITFEDSVIPLAFGIILERTEKKYQTGAIYVKMTEKFFGKVLDDLIASKYKFFVYEEKSRIFTYYKWNHPSICDRVPEVSNARIGVGVLLLSPDENDICLISEKGNEWGRITGGVSRGENSLNAAAREVKEETGLDVDPNFSPMFIGGWMCPDFHPYGVSDAHHVFLMKATSRDFHPDFTEIENIKWMSLGEAAAIVRDDESKDIDYETKIFLKLYFQNVARLVFDKEKVLGDKYLIF